MTAPAGHSRQLQHPADGGTPAATAQPWQVLWRALLRRGVVLDPETAQVLADTVVLALQQVTEPARPRPRTRPRTHRRPGPEAGCDPMF